MSDAASEDLTSANPGDGVQGLAGSYNAPELSNPLASSSNTYISPPAKTEEVRQHVRDSKYGSVTSTPDRQETATSLRKPSQNPWIRQAGLFVSNKTMEPETRLRFREVQLQIEKMLFGFMRRLKTTQGRHKPIAIRSMMLGKTDDDADAEAYMVVICPEDIKRKVREFFDEPLVKSLCEPADDDDVASFKTLVIGRELRLRASTSDVEVQCGALHKARDGRRLSCRPPIRLDDEFGNSRNARFGGPAKVTKYGVLSTTRARVLLEPGDGFIDAYTLTLEASVVRDGDSGSWIVDEPGLEVYGHVIADDVFGDAYLVPMRDTLADIQRYFGAASADLPMSLDIFSMGTEEQASMLVEPNPGDRPCYRFIAKRTKGSSDSSFQCDMEGCGKLFSRRYNFTAHMKTHYEKVEHNFPCQVDACNKKFKRNTDLQRHHQSVHAKERNYKCDYCERRFARKESLQRHLYG